MGEPVIEESRLRRTLRRWATTVLIATSSTAPFSPATAQGARSDSGEPAGLVVDGALMPGDAIRLAGTHEQGLPGDYPVDETGAVVLPLLGTRHVTNVAAAELKRQLAADFREQLRNQDVQISLLRRVRVLGAVKNPGIYLVDPTMNVADAIALAGGAASDGKLKGIRIVRAGKVTRSNLDGDALVAGDIRSGDQIMVPERSWLSRNGQFAVGALISALGFVVAQAISH